ncbi:MAG TPA: hypothetical protein DD671_05090, partial [Balneolaceae bacterium]|nr:hypothetical protein [Balneolaceae bacterium]
MFLSRKPEILARAVRAVFVLMLSLSTLFVQAQQIDLSLNDEKLLAGESILIPVNTSEILESDAVIAGEFEFSFNDDVVDITGVETSGTILENEGSTNYFEGTDRFSFAAPDTISGSGVLFYLKATANPNASYFDRTDFDIVSAMLNEGNPGVSITNAEANVEIKGVRINPDNNIDVIEGETLQFNLQDDFQAPITWEVSNPAIASISSNGLLSANAVGNIQVKATDAQGLKDSTEIFRIQPANLQNLNVSIPDTSEQQTKIIDVPVKVSDVSGLQIKSVQLDVRFNNLYLDLQEVLHAGTKTDTWGDPTVNIDADGVEIASAGTAALDGSGNLFLLRFKVTGERTGNSNVEFQEAQFNEELIPNFQNGSFEVEPAPSIEIFPADTAVSIGNQLQFQVTGGNGTPPYTWMVDDNSIATIDGGTGTLEGVSRGEVSVNVTDSEGFSSELVQVQVNSFDAYIDTVESINPDTVEMSLNTADLSSHNILSYEAGFRYNTDKLDFIGLNPAQTQSAGLNIEVKDSADVIRVVAAATSAISGQGPIIKFMFKAKQSVNDGDELKFDLKYLRFNEPGPTVPTTTPIPGYLNVTLIAPPSAPTLQAPSDGSADTDTTLSLEWAEVTEADEYQVQVSKDQNFSTLWLNQITTQTLQELSTLDFSTTYYWRVRSLNAGGESNWSSTYSFTTYDGLTEAIDLVEPADGVEDISIDDITFSWNAATLADGYQWQVSSQSDFSSFVRDSSGISSTSVITSLDYGTQYYWRVRGVNAQGNGSWSTTHTFSTQIAPPDTPVPFDPGDGAGQQDTVLTLKWLETARADSFKLQVSEVNDFSTVLIAETVNDTSNTIHGLEYTSQYYWRVKAFNTTGESNWSTEFSFTTREPDATIPSLNSPANNASDLDTALTLTWSDAENADSYQVQVST